MSVTVPTLECRFEGKTYKISDTTFFSDRGIYSCRMEDYTLITNFDCTSLFDRLTKTLKFELRDRWRYSMHVSHGMTLSVTRSLLYARVTGGEILGYKFAECSIDGNECAYYGIIPTQHKDLKDTHLRCRLSMMAVFPRRLYVYLEHCGECSCGANGCATLQSIDRSGTRKTKFCANAIPWSKLYVMMGELDNACAEQSKEARDCKVCAQCYNCSKSVRFCRNHRVCRHKRSRVDTADSFATDVAAAAASTTANIAIPKIRDCKRVKK